MADREQRTAKIIHVTKKWLPSPCRTPTGMGWATQGRFYLPHSRRVLLSSNVELTLNRKLSNGVGSVVENGNGPPNQYQGSEENRGHAFGRVSDTSVRTALACRIHFYSDK